jgi:hypothetical protein
LLSEFPVSLEREGYILLDGIEYELTFTIEKVTKKYTWKIPTEDIRYFQPLIDFLISAGK